MRCCLLIGIVALAGCGSTKLETGYEPRPLGASDAVRRGYYAAPFTAEAKAAAADQEGEMEMRRPGPQP